MKKLILLAAICLAPISSALAQTPPEPTEHHKVLAMDVGVWDAKMKISMPGGGESVPGSGSETVTAECSGLWVRTSFEGSIGPMKFSGIGMTTYDVAKKKFVGYWGDSMSTSPATMVGSYDEKSKTMTYQVTSIDPMSGKSQVAVHKVVYDDKDHRTFTIMTDGQTTLEIKYTRRSKIDDLKMKGKRGLDRLKEMKLKGLEKMKELKNKGLGKLEAIKN